VVDGIEKRGCGVTYLLFRKTGVYMVIVLLWCWYIGNEVARALLTLDDCCLLQGRRIMYSSVVTLSTRHCWSKFLQYFPLLVRLPRDIKSIGKERT